MASKCLELLDKISKAESAISNASYVKQKAEEELEEMLDPFKINGLKAFIAKKIMENMDSSYIEKIMADRKDELDNFIKCTSTSSSPYSEVTSTCYKCSSIFDPEHDEFKIYSYNFNEDGTKVMFNVECIKLREYLGITGSWFPHIFSTVWFDKEELCQFDDE